MTTTTTTVINIILIYSWSFFYFKNPPPPFCMKNCNWSWDCSMRHAMFYLYYHSFMCVFMKEFPLYNWTWVIWRFLLFYERNIQIHYFFKYTCSLRSVQMTEAKLRPFPGQTNVVVVPFEIISWWKHSASSASCPEHFTPVVIISSIDPPK